MKVAFIQIIGMWPAHMAVDMELMEEHAARGDDVHLFACAGDLLSCDENADHNWMVCQACKFQRNRAMTAVQGRYSTSAFPVLTRQEKSQLLALPAAFSGTEELRKFKFANFDAGEAVLSTMISRYRNPFQDVVFDANLVRRLLLSGVGVYLALRREIRERKIGKMYVFNGRLSGLRAALRACQAEGVECQTHDRGFDQHHYHLFGNRMVHELRPYADDIVRAWDSAPSPVRENAAVRFFELRRAGVIPNWRSYTEAQKQSLLPSGWRADRRNVAVFISSDDEFAAAGEEWRNRIYPEGQARAISVLAKELEGRDPSLHLWVRVHPNLKGVRNEATRQLMQLHGSNISIIAADSQVGSYALLDACEKVLTFGSTVGIEAVFWGKPSVLAGPAFYQYLPGCVVPQTHQEVVEALCARLPVPDRLGALQYGHNEGTFGTPYKVYKAKTPFEGTYRGLELGDMVAPPKRIKWIGALPPVQKWWMLKAKAGLTGRLKW